MHAFSKSKRLHVHFSGIGICAIVQLPRHHLGPIRLHLVVVGNGEPVLQTQSKIFSPRNIVVLGNARCPRVDARALVWRQTRTALLVVLQICQQLRRDEMNGHVHAHAWILVATNAVEPITLLENLSSKYLTKSEHVVSKRWRNRNCKK
jgi:hypothetical protein